MHFTGSSFILSINQTTFVKSLVDGFLSTTNDLNAHDPCMFIFHLILNGTLCTFSVALADRTEGVLG